MPPACQLTMTVSERQSASRKKIAKKKTRFEGTTKPRTWAREKIGPGNIAHSNAMMDSESQSSEYINRRRFFTTSRITYAIRSILTCVPLAQLDRASASGAEGRGFESHRGHHFSTMQSTKRANARTCSLASSTLWISCPNLLSICENEFLFSLRVYEFHVGQCSSCSRRHFLGIELLSWRFNN